MKEHPILPVAHWRAHSPTLAARRRPRLDFWNLSVQTHAYEIALGVPHSEDLAKHRWGACRNDLARDREHHAISRRRARQLLLPVYGEQADFQREEKGEGKARLCLPRISGTCQV